MINYSDFDEMFKAADRASNALIALYELYKEKKKAEDEPTPAKKPCESCAKRKEVKSTAKAKLSPPWYKTWNMLKVLFKDDAEVEISDIVKPADSSQYLIYLDCTTPEKAFALANILKTTYHFGKVTLFLKFRVPNGKKLTDKPNSLYDTALEAFASTPAITDIKKCQDMFGDTFVVIEFVKEIVQFYNDELLDFYGNYNGTYLDVAKELFKVDNSLFTTITEDE